MRNGNLSNKVLGGKNFMKINFPAPHILTKLFSGSRTVFLFGEGIQVLRENQTQKGLYYNCNVVEARGNCYER